MFIDVEYIYIIMITWRHFGKPEIVAVINNRICASLQIRQLLTGRTAQGITVVHHTREAEGGGGRL